MNTIDKLAGIDTDLLKNPEKYGFVSFEQYRKEKSKWRPNAEQALESVDRAGTLFKGKIREIKYELEGYPCETLEAVQSQARAMGFAEKDLLFFPVPHNHLAGKFDILVRFFHKDTVRKREDW